MTDSNKQTKHKRTQGEADLSALPAVAPQSQNDNDDASMKLGHKRTVGTIDLSTLPPIAPQGTFDEAMNLGHRRAAGMTGLDNFGDGAFKRNPIFTTQFECASATSPSLLKVSTGPQTHAAKPAFRPRLGSQ